MRDRFILLKRPSEISTEERDLMGPWFEAFPTLGLAYELKEGFFGVWKTPARVKMRKRFLMRGR